MRKPGQSHWVVLKFGGTSVSTAERWRTIAAVARERMAAGARPVVVCSAMKGVSDLLVRLLEAAGEGRHRPILDEIMEPHVVLARAFDLDAKTVLAERLEALVRVSEGVALLGEASAAVRARAMAAGELMSTELGAAILKQQGVAVHWVDARSMLCALPDPGRPGSGQYLAAACSAEPDDALQQRLAAHGDGVILTQGFIARNDDGETVLLGRGGSDTSAAYVAAMLQARRLEIWTDVPGMFTANPHQVPSARLLRRLGYEEAQELATVGAGVLHPRCIEPVQRLGIPLHIRCTQAPEIAGTVITDDVPDEGTHVKAVTAKTGVTLLSMDALGMWQQQGFVSRIFDVLGRHGLSVDMISTSATNVTVSLDPATDGADASAVTSVLRSLRTFCVATEIGPCAVVSLVGHNIRSILHALGPSLEAIDQQRVYLVSKAASDLNFTFVIDEKQADRLVRTLHSQLFDRQQSDRLFGPSWEAIFDTGQGSDVPPSTWWRTRRDTLLRLAGRQSPLYVYDERTLRDAIAGLRKVEAVDRVFYSVKANTHPDVLRVFYEAGLGFECISPGEVRHVLGLFPDLDPDRILFTLNYAPREEYVFGFERGVHVVLDGIAAIRSWPDVFAGRDVIVRMDPGRGHGRHDYVRTAGPQSKFGVAPAQLGLLKEAVDAAGARVVGLHAHVGSGIKTPETWAQTAVFLAGLADAFPDVRILNLGGGLGLPDRPATPGLDVDVVADRLATFKAADPRFELWMEPGRYLTAHAGVLLTRVTQVKQKDLQHFVGVETGMNSFIRPVLYGAYHEIVNLTKLDAPTALTAEVVGPICEAADVLGHARRLPHTETGDVMLVATAGAYGHVMRSNYNLRPPAEEVFLNEGGV